MREKKVDSNPVLPEMVLTKVSLFHFRVNAIKMVGGVSDR